MDHRAGFPTLADYFSRDVAEKCAEWLKYRSTESAPEDWPELIPLPGLEPVKEFNVALLPSTIGPWCLDIANRMQCPADYIGVAAIVALGSVIGNKVTARPKRKDNWYEAANLWGLTVGLSGTMRSPAMKEALGPLHRLEIAAREQNARELKLYEHELKLFKIKDDLAKHHVKRELEKNINSCCANDLAIEEPEKPRARQFIANDSSYEKLGEILAYNPNGVLVHRDELVCLLKELEREEKVAARGFYLTAWGGKDPYTFDRIIRGQTFISATCVGMLGSTQPSAEFIHASLSRSDDGMLQRFGLLVWPDTKSTWEYIDEAPEHDPKETAWETFRYLADLKPEDVDAIDNDGFAKIPYLRFSAEAQEIFIEWRTEHQRRLLSDEFEPALKSHFNKYRKLVVSLALINHLAEHEQGPISATALLRALAMAAYLETHAKRAYGAGTGVPAAAAAILQHIKRGDLTQGFTVRTIYRSHWSGLSDSEHVQKALSLLEESNYIRAKKEDTGGAPSITYLINPKVWS